MSKKRYLGDAVYADFDLNGLLVLTTEDGIRVSNRIVFEEETWAALVKYVREVYVREVPRAD